MKLFLRYKFALILIIPLLVSSCRSTKRYVYLENMEKGIEYQSIFNNKTTIRIDDRLNIYIASKNPELALPFNLNTGISTIDIDKNDSPMNTKNTSVTPQNKSGYLVDSNGNIDFPILGKIKVEGLNLDQVKDLIKNKIISGNYIKEPTVLVDFANLKFYVLGEVANVGEHELKGNRVTLLEAIAQAGDLTDNGRADRVIVIRRNGEINQKFVHDLQSKDIFASPCFYIQQNDIIYVEGINKKAEQNFDSFYKYFSVIISTVSAGVAIYVLSQKGFN